MNDQNKNQNTSPVEISSEHDSYSASLDRAELGNKLAIMNMHLEELLRNTPNKGTVESTQNLINQVLGGIGNVASKDNLRELSGRIGKIEDTVGSISQSSILNERAVSDLKTDLKELEEDIEKTANKFETALEKKKEEFSNSLNETSTDIRELRKDISNLSNKMHESRHSDRKWSINTLLTVLSIVVAVLAVIYANTGSTGIFPQP